MPAVAASYAAKQSGRRHRSAGVAPTSGMLMLIGAYCGVDLLWPPYGIGQAVIFLPCGFYLLLLSSSFLA